MPDLTTNARLLNQRCDCITLDEARLGQALHDEVRGMGLAPLPESHPHLFARTAFFVDRDNLEAMARVVAAVERVVRLPGYLEQVLSESDPIVRHDPGTRGAFLGFDFHLADHGPQLIEINTNAGGGLLNALLRQAQRACCEPIARAFGLADQAGPAAFLPMLESEWRMARGERRLLRVAIVDDDPASQYLYPEFLLFARVAEAHGWSPVVCDAADLEIRDDRLYAGSELVDLVYNRTTDFALAEPRHAALRQAYLGDLAVITPHPRAHAVYADKRRLSVLSDPEALARIGVTSEDRALLMRHVPRTRIVDPSQREALWQARKGLFFKPNGGYGGKAAYRGDKLTRAVFEQILGGAYVAQALVPPSSRVLCGDDVPVELKADVRNFAYAGEVQLVCARLYQGQTTNFRTPGGGFAPVYVATRESADSCATVLARASP
jgi:glutathione synthase/RimK-type ligase-like ATP-grasp enzyme